MFWGENVINMLLLYFLRAYIKKYNYCDKFRNKLLVKIFCFTTLANFALNLLISMLAGGKAHIPFARDCSAFVMIEATTLLMLFLKHEFHSESVNKIAKHVFAVYLFEGAIRQTAVWHSLVCLNPRRPPMRKHWSVRTPCPASLL